MTPQATTVLRHLQTTGSITGIEAEQVHRVRHLPARIRDLKHAGYAIEAVRKMDTAGQRYVRYLLQRSAAA